MPVLNFLFLQLYVVIVFVSLHLCVCVCVGFSVCVVDFAEMHYISSMNQFIVATLGGNLSSVHEQSVQADLTLRCDCLLSGWPLGTAGGGSSEGSD